MTPFWIDLKSNMRLAIVLRPRGNDWLEDEIRLLRQAGVNVLVSMLQPQEAEELGLIAEEELCDAAGIQFHSYPIPDRETPTSFAAFRAFVDELRTEAHAGRAVAVHCRASIGRSSLLLAALLTAEGYTAQGAFELLTNARGLTVPDTIDQVAWVERFATMKTSVFKQ